MLRYVVFLCSILRCPASASNYKELYENTCYITLSYVVFLCSILRSPASASNYRRIIRKHVTMCFCSESCLLLLLHITTGELYENTLVTFCFCAASCVLPHLRLTTRELYENTLRYIMLCFCAASCVLPRLHLTTGELYENTLRYVTLRYVVFMCSILQSPASASNYKSISTTHIKGTICPTARNSVLCYHPAGFPRRSTTVSYTVVLLQTMSLVCPYTKAISRIHLAKVNDA